MDVVVEVVNVEVVGEEETTEAMEDHGWITTREVCEGKRLWLTDGWMSYRRSEQGRSNYQPSVHRTEYEVEGWQVRVNDMECTEMVNLRL